jgi:hypothetical protein
MSTDTLIRITEQGRGFDVLCSINHSKYKRLQSQPGYITRIRFEVNESPVMEIDLGPNLPDNPVIGIHLNSLGLNDRVSAIWIDTFGAKGTAGTSLATQS